MPHFFISYAKKDTRELALALSDALNTLPNVTAWVDRSLKAGKSWELQIQTEIDKCDYFVVLYSPDINRHKLGQDESYVLTEIAYAKYQRKRPIIPVMAQSTEAPMSLTTLHYIDFTLKGLTLNDLLAAICDEAGIQASTLTAAPSQTKAAVEAPKAVALKPSKPTSLDLLPKPFAWIEIPKKGYSMGKYPVTNLQFAEFIKAGGYKEQKWWTKEGWQQRESEKWTEPRYWADSQWNSAEQPVVGVSWYESVAFCLWLRDITGEKIMLPSEEQWQYAAQGDDGRAYPWGNDWDSAKCRNSVDGGYGSAGNTSPVRQYEGKGDSPFGLVDMAGNVWEWCLTDYEQKTNDVNSTATDHVLRGGSWSDFLTGNFRCGYRVRDVPHGWNDVFGFRLFRFN